MTEAELAAIVEGIAPVLRDQIKVATQHLESEIRTLRDAQVALEMRLLAEQKAAFEARCQDLEVRLIAAVTPRGVPNAAIA